jgi:hypothetical protein
MAYSAEVVFVETPVFTRRVQEYLDDEAYGHLQAFLAEHPDTGKIIRQLGRHPKGAVAWERPRKARRIAGNLLLVDGKRSHLDVDDLSEE